MSCQKSDSESYTFDNMDFKGRLRCDFKGRLTGHNTYTIMLSVLKGGGGKEGVD